MRVFKADPGSDLGPSVRRDKRGRLVSWGGAVAIEVESRPDPTISDRVQLVRGARRRDVLCDLHARNAITKRMRDAAERFIEDCSIASGSRAAVEGLPSAPGPRAGLPERQVSAIARVNQVRHLLGLNAGTVFWHVVFDNRPLTDFEKHNRLRNGEATGMLRTALAALDEHYHREFGAIRYG